MNPEQTNPERAGRVATPFGWSLPTDKLMSLVDRFGVGEEQRRERQEFLGLTPQDGENLRRLRPVFAAFAREFAERFYAKVLSHPHTAAFFRDPAQLDRLKGLQADYFARLLEGHFDRDYFESRLRVGLTHQRVGVEPVWYLGMYNQYVQLTFPHFVEALGGDAAEALPVLLSLVKVIFLDVGLALDTYFLEARAKLLDLAAILDRVDRGGGAEDPRLAKVRQALEVLGDRSAGRAERVQKIFSLDYDPGWERPQPR
jgi:hypothetical protein